MAEIIELGKRKFRTIENSTVEHDFTAIQLLGKAGLDAAAKREDESYDDFAVRLMSQIISSGHAFDLVSAFIIPEELADHDWTPKIGVDTAAFIRKLSAQEDKVQIRQLVVTLLAGFSQAGMLSFAASTDASPAAAPRPAVEATTSTGSLPGAISSERSPGQIQPLTWAWLAALSRRLFTRTRTPSAATRGTSTK